jgi:SPP1 gp7 family putative phage head morphogenesis protein
MLLQSKYDSVFSEADSNKTTSAYAGDRPILSAKTIVSTLDEVEDRFAKSALAIVSNQTDKMVAKLESAIANGNIKEIQAAKWGTTAPLQQLVYSLWYEGWGIGQKHGLQSLNRIRSKENNEFSEHATDLSLFASEDKPIIKTDVTIKKKDRTIKTSRQLQNQAAYIPDQGIPIEQSGLRQALNDRTLKLASDLDATTQKEIKEALVAAATPQPKTGKPISREQLEARINLALGRQKARTGEEVRTKIPKIGGGFFSRAKLIARTELTAAYATSNLAAYQAAGVTHVRWVSLEDLQRCPKCTSRHGMVVATNDTATIAANPIPLHPNCFPAGTQILMSDGKTKAIENIRSQDRVYTATAARVQPVYNTFKSKISGFLVKFTLEDGRTIESTPEHPFWNGSCFVAASTIKTGQSLWLSAYLGENSKNEVRPIQANIPRNQNSFNRTKEVRHTPTSFQGLTPLRVIKIEQTPFEGFVYNFSVENDEVYVANGILVHNCRCLWQPIPNGKGGDGIRNDPGRNPSGMGLAAVAASWVLGRGANSIISEEAREVTENAQQGIAGREERNKFLAKLIVATGAGVLSLAALYYLIVKTKVKLSAKGITKAVAENIEDASSILAKKVENVIKEQPQQQESQPQARPSYSNNYNYNPRRVLSEEAQEQFPDLAKSNADLRNISLKDLMRLTGLMPKEAKTLKEEILEWIRQDLINKRNKVQAVLAPSENNLQIQGVDINQATISQLQDIFGLPKAAAVKVRAYLDKGNSITKVEDLGKVPGIGDRYIARVASRESRFRPNINSVPNTRAAAAELAAQLGIGTKLAQAILDERDEAGGFQNISELAQRVKSRLGKQPSEMGKVYLGKVSIGKISEGVDFISPSSPAQPDTQGVGVDEQKLLPGGKKPKNTTKITPSTRSPGGGGGGGLTPSIVNTLNKRANRVVPPSKRTDNAPKGFTELDAEYERLANEVDNYHSVAQSNISKKLRNRQRSVDARANNASYQARQAYIRANDIASRLGDVSARIESQVENIEKSYQQFLNPLNEPYFDVAPGAIKAQSQAISRSLLDIKAQDSFRNKAVEEIETRIRELQILRQEIRASAQAPNISAQRNALSSRVDDLNQRVGGLAASPQSQELQRQIQVLGSELSVDRDRTVEAITNKIAEMELLSANIRQDPNGVKLQINTAKRKLQELRDRLKSLPTSTKQLDEAASSRYKQARKVAATQTKIQSSVAKYREDAAGYVAQLDDFASKQSQAIANYELQRNSALNNLSSTIAATQSRINYDMQLLRLMSGPEGVAWVLEQVETGTEAGLILRNLNPQRGVRSIKTMEEAAKFREYAMSTLHGRVIGQSQLLEERLDYPKKLAQQFLDDASAKLTEAVEMQKAIAIKHQADSREVIERLTDWEQSLAVQTPGGGVAVNETIRNAKNQVVDEITNSRISNAQNAQGLIENQNNWRTALGKELEKDYVFEVEGKAVTRSQISESLKAIDTEANQLRSMQQVTVEPARTPEAINRSQQVAAYRAQIDQLQSQVNTLQQELGKVTQEINKRLEAKAQGRKISPVERLQAEQAGLQQQINSRLERMDEITRNRNFYTGAKLLEFNSGNGNNNSVYSRSRLCLPKKSTSKLLFPTSKPHRSASATLNLNRTNRGRL